MPPEIAARCTQMYIWIHPATFIWIMWLCTLRRAWLTVFIHTLYLMLSLCSYEHVLSTVAHSDFVTPNHITAHTIVDFVLQNKTL